MSATLVHDDHDSPCVFSSTYFYGLVYSDRRIFFLPFSGKRALS